MLQSSDINIQMPNVEPYVFVDEISGITRYTGVSSGYVDIYTSNWKIKKEWKVGNVWYMGFPDGSQDFKFVWEDRATYTYQ